MYICNALNYLCVYLSDSVGTVVSIVMVSIVSYCICGIHLQEAEGTESEVNHIVLLNVLADFIQLRDPSMLSLEVSGLVAKYPDIR